MVAQRCRRDRRDLVGKVLDGSAARWSSGARWVGAAFLGLGLCLPVNLCGAEKLFDFSRQRDGEVPDGWLSLVT